MEQKSSDGVGDGRPLCAQHAVAAYLDAFHFHSISKFGSVAYLHFQKQNRVLRREIVILTVLCYFSPILFRVALFGGIGDEAKRSLARRLVEETLRSLV